MMANTDSGDIKQALAGVRSGNADSMKRVYALTAPQLYGKLQNILKDEASARRALHATYLCLWRQRHELEFEEGREFEIIAALAHRYALADRFQTTGDDHLAARQDATALFNRGSGAADSLHMLDERDRAVLKAAYLEFESIEALARKHDMAPGDMREHLARLASGKGGQSNG